MAGMPFFMSPGNLLPHLFRTEYHKLVSVLTHLFGLQHIQVAEDIASDTFLLAAELWGMKGIPPNPQAWLYKVAKNKTIDYLKREQLFEQKIAGKIQSASADSIELNLSPDHINDSQLAMMFAVCHPSISTEAQIGLSLNILCGFGAEEIAEAFLDNKETIYKRLQRAKEKLKTVQADLETPTAAQAEKRLPVVLTMLYLLFNEGYYSSAKNTSLRKDFCLEAMRLNLLLVNHASTNTPEANALLSLMCFHASRFDARRDHNGAMILYQDQDTSLWNAELIQKGAYYLNASAGGKRISKYHLEAAIAYWHTKEKDSPEKWEQVLQLYNRLLQIEYTPVAALNRTYVLARANGFETAIIEAEKLVQLEGHVYYQLLLGHLYEGINKEKALHHLQKARVLARTADEKNSIALKLAQLAL